jgi:hypothetical protein
MAELNPEAVADPAAAPVALPTTRPPLDMVVSFDVTGSMMPVLAAVRDNLDRLTATIFAADREQVGSGPPSLLRIDPLGVPSLRWELKRSSKGPFISTDVELDETSPLASLHIDMVHPKLLVRGVFLKSRPMSFTAVLRCTATATPGRVWRSKWL